MQGNAIIQAVHSLRHVLFKLAIALPCVLPAAPGPIQSVAELYRAIYQHHGETASFDIRARVNAVNYEGERNFSEIAVGSGDGNIGLLVLPHVASFIPKPGDLIRATGYISYGEGHKRYANVKAFEFLRHETPPPPLEASLAELLKGHRDFQYVSVRATVRDAVRSILNENWITLGIIDEQCSMAVPVRADAPTAERLLALIGQDVVIRGFCSPSDPGRKQTGRQIRICDPTAIQLAQKDGKQSSVPSIDDIENSHPNVIATLGVHSASGIVVAVWQHRHAIVRESNGRHVRVDFREPEAPPAGTAVTVHGFPESNFIHVKLINATVVSSTASTLPHEAATDVKIPSFRLGTKVSGMRYYTQLHGKLVRTCGTILTMPSEENDWRMSLESDGECLAVEAEPLIPALGGLTGVCEIQLSGVCVVEAETWHSISPQNVKFLLVPRFESDLAVLSRPSWWTPARLLLAICALLTALFGIILWNFLLRKAALQKGRALAREQLKHLKAETKAVERTRLAVELHDTLSQTLTGVSLEITAAAQCGKGNAEGMLKHLSIASRTLDSCRNTLRDSLWDLRNHALEDRDMNAAIRTTLQPHVKGIELVVRFNVQRKKITENTTHDILCIIRELALNGIRHGRATVITVAGCVDNGKILFSVKDNGCGFDPNACPGVCEGHFGMQGIRERLSGLHGSIVYESDGKQGTKAKVVVPLHDDIE